MSSRLPIVRQIAWLSVLPQLLLIALIMGLLYLAGVQQPFFVGALTYLTLALVLRGSIARTHRRGVSRFKRRQFEEAIRYFEDSYDFFTRHPWIDEWRFLTILSSSQIGYREMALLNIAFCHTQLGDGRKAKEFYQRTLDEYPDSKMARTSLRMIESAEQAVRSEAD